MPLSLYDVSIPLFIRNLKNLTAILQKGQEFAKEKGVPESQLLETRLAPDMAALPFQIQRVSDISKGVAVRVGGADPVPMEDNEKTFPELYARIQKTIDVLEAVDPKSFDGKETAEVTIRGRGGDIKLTGKTNVINVAIPNFFFHMTAAYAILRHCGVPVGKYDYLGAP
jgi:uncharacterized protein